MMLLCAVPARRDIPVPSLGLVPAKAPLCEMRAQITGLNAASKNVKDGISLVKTAEGAMQEIQDMLNRMDYLATQSANGTYDNDVDRKALQKEVNQLNDEINRIAESANFNGIKLLDGTWDVDATVPGVFTP